MCIEFMHSSHGIFISTNPTAEICFHESGLFPSVTADPSLFLLLGVLVAKAISLEIALEIEFNPAFFDLARDRPVALSSVDHHLASALNCPEGLIGLDFTYPGHPDFPLLPDGQFLIVDHTNVHKYIELIESMTFSETVKLCAIRFVEGFSRVLPFRALDIFTSSEITLLIQGDRELITIEDLENAFEISHGYTRQSPQIQMLFETIAEMNREEQSRFICFVTGTHRLPIGGLRSLSPRMTVMRRGDDDIDGSLPTASTCNYLLKLPPYSSKEILRSKVMMAIGDGLNSFALS
jgi:E3 ubiquitin-protein ligase TRIP12